MQFAVWLYALVMDAVSAVSCRIRLGLLGTVGSKRLYRVGLDSHGMVLMCVGVKIAYSSENVYN